MIALNAKNKLKIITKEYKEQDAIPYVFGYWLYGVVLVSIRMSFNKKGYLLFDQSSKKVFVSRQCYLPWTYLSLSLSLHSILINPTPTPQIVLPFLNTVLFSFHHHHPISLKLHLNHHPLHILFLKQSVSTHSSTQLSETSTPSSSTSSSLTSPPTPITSPPPAPPLRTSIRTKSIPTKLHDYHHNLPKSSAHSVHHKHHHSHFLNYSNIHSSKFKHFIVSLDSTIEPHTYKQASKDPRWIEAMTKEISAFESNHTWELITLPSNKHPIGCKWIYTIKYHANGSIERFKARLVAKGFTQRERVDYKETFARLPKWSPLGHFSPLLFIKARTSNKWMSIMRFSMLI